MIRCLLSLSLFALVVGCGDDGGSAAVDAQQAIDAAATESDAMVGASDADLTIDADVEDAMLAPCFVGDVGNAEAPNTAGPGVTPVWAYQGMIGIVAGNNMCKAIGADHVCNYAEVLVAEGRGELAQSFGPTDTFWLHRSDTTVTVGNASVPPGAGGRCNDWTYPGNALADGEFALMGSGSVTYNFDSNTCYTSNAGDGCAEAGLACGGVLRAIPCCSASCGL
jgi:hypothetical protein